MSPTSHVPLGIEGKIVRDIILCSSYSRKLLEGCRYAVGFAIAQDSEMLFQDMGKMLVPSSPGMCNALLEEGPGFGRNKSDCCVSTTLRESCQSSALTKSRTACVTSPVTSAKPAVSYGPPATMPDWIEAMA